MTSGLHCPSRATRERQIAAIPAGPHKGRKPCANKRLHGRRAPEEHAMSHDLKLPRRPKAVPAGAGSTRTEPGRWTVSTRAIGEVLTTELRCDDLRLLLF